MLPLRSVLVLVGAVCALFLLSGSFAHAADGKVTGVITIKGTPLASGRILFHLDNGQFVGAKVKDGKYTVDRVPTGSRVITVEGKDVPDKYASDVLSDLKAKINEGKSTINIELK